jgi:hypothetical protein
MCDALREGLAAYRQYEHPRSRGILHDKAVSAALGAGPTPTGAGEQARPLFEIERAAD